MTIASALGPGPILEHQWRAKQRTPLHVPTNGTVPSSDRWEAALNKLAGFRDLQEDWDGQGAHPPSSELVDSALGLAALIRERGMEPPTGVAPGPMGTLMLVCHGSNGTYCEIELERPFQAEVMFLQSGQAARHWMLPEVA